MSSEEIAGKVTSEELTVDEMVQFFEEEVKDDTVSNNKKYDNLSECEGNILTPCIRDGLTELSRAAENHDLDYSVIGGIGTQLRGLADCEDIIRVGDHFGRRQTSDIDILVEDYGDSLSILREYNPSGKPSLDVVQGHIPGDEEIIANSEEVDFGEINDQFDFTLQIPTNEDLVYSKVWYPKLEEKDGTRYDLDKYVELQGYMFDLDEEKLRDTIKRRAPDQNVSIDYLIRAGFDI